MKNVLFSSFMLMMSMATLPMRGQTYAYKLIKAISQDGEVKEINEGKKVYVTFTNNKGTFYISKRDGSRAGWPDASTGYASGFNNQKTLTSSSGLLIDQTGFCREVQDPQNFKHIGMQGDIHIYENKRPLLAMDPISRNIYISDYTVDYAKFNGDYSRINVIPSFDKGMYGFVPFGLGLSGWSKEWTTYVFEQVKQANANGQDFY